MLVLVPQYNPMWLMRQHKLFRKKEYFFFVFLINFHKNVLLTLSWKNFNKNSFNWHIGKYYWEKKNRAMISEAGGSGEKKKQKTVRSWKIKIKFALLEFFLLYFSILCARKKFFCDNKKINKNQVWYQKIPLHPKTFDNF